MWIMINWWAPLYWIDNIADRELSMLVVIHKIGFLGGRGGDSLSSTIRNLDITCYVNHILYTRLTLNNYPLEDIRQKFVEQMAASVSTRDVSFFVKLDWWISSLQFIHTGCDTQDWLMRLYGENKFITFRYYQFLIHFQQNEAEHITIFIYTLEIWYQ